MSDLSLNKHFTGRSEMRHNSVKPIGFSSESIEIHRAEKQTHVQRWAAHRRRLSLSFEKDSVNNDVQHDFDVSLWSASEEHKDKRFAVEFYNQGALTVKKKIQMGEIDEQWKKEEHIKKFQTNAFGKIDFQYEGLGGRKPAKYIRLSDDTDVELVLKLLKNHWHMDHPRQANLVITVIGGAKNFKLDGRRKEVFNRGLVSAAQTTNAWIITSGFNMGVMRAVGEAVAEAQSYTYDKNGMTHTLRCLGIAPWGYVLDNKSLINKHENGSWNATYKPSKVIEHGSLVSLNPHHTHFLLVDDGYRGKYGGVAEFRARLESKLAASDDPKLRNEAHSGIPVVLVLVEGGYDAIKDVSRSIEARIPCVVCEGTGRAADILSYAYHHYVTTRNHERIMKDKHRLILEDKLIDAYGKTWAERSDIKKEVANYVETVLKCCKDEKLITVFDMNKNEELDVAILSALLKGKGAKNLDQLHDQLRLALTWNRTDIARDDIFTMNVTWPSGSLNDIMTDALIDDKTGFIRLLLQNGLIMDEYLTAPKLRMLYNKATKTHHLREMLKNETSSKVFTLKHIGKLIQQLLDKYDYSEYKKDVDIKAVERNIEVSLGDENDKLMCPFKDLFMWAVLMNRQELAKFFWEHGDAAIPSALAACKIYDSMMKKLPYHDTDLRNMYMKNKYEFECLAIKVLDECNSIDPEKAALLIERKYSGWGNMDCLELAALAENKEFLSTVCCQNSLSLMWKRGIASHTALVPLCLIFPPLIFCVVKFQSLGDVHKELTPHQKLTTFYRAPVTKFTGHLIMYMIFLILYSYMLLFGYKEQVTPVEWFVIVWLITIIVEEFRQMFFNSLAETFKQRLNLWWNFSAFNRVDALVTVLVILTLILRFVSGFPVMYAKNVYSIMCIFLFIRVLREYSASSSLGPKLVMINQMLKELILFMMILLVFLLAYGISSQALMHPFRDFSPIIFRDILYYPYWQVYGEIYLDELEGRTDDCRNSSVNADGYPCPRFSWLVIIFTACYLLFGNLLLLNILIAIFNNVFNEIQTNSIQVWKYGIYFLVVEYDNKPTLAPPFIIFEHFYEVLKWFCQRTCCKQQVPDNSAELLNYKMTLKIFEKECVKGTLRKEQITEQEFLPKKLAFIYNRVDEMAKILEEEHMMEQRHFEAEQNKLERQQSAGLSESDLERLHESASFSDVGSLSGSDSFPQLVSFSQPKSISRWPSLATIKSLKAKMETIEEMSPKHEPVLPSAVLVDTSYNQRGYQAENPTAKSFEQQQLQDQTFASSHQDQKSKGSKGSRRREKKHKWMNRRYEELIDDHDTRDEQFSSLSHVPVEGRDAGVTMSRQIQKNMEELEIKLGGMNERLTGLEESMQNIGSLLRIAINQRSLFEGGRQPVPARPDPRQTIPVSHEPSLLTSVPPTVPPLDAFNTTDNDGHHVLPMVRNQQQISADSFPLLHPISVQNNYSTLLQVDTTPVPPTHPPTNPFGHLDSSIS